MPRRNYNWVGGRRWNPKTKKIEYINEDGDFILDGFDDSLIEDPRYRNSMDSYNDTSSRTVEDDTDDYEYKQEEAYGLQSEDLQPNPTDRYLKRFGKG